MYKYYSKEQEIKHGVMAFILEKPNHVCRTCVKVWTETRECFAIYNDRLLNTDVNSPEYEQMDDRFDSEKIENALNEIADGLEAERFADCFTFGINDEYNADVNVMIRKTLEKLFGTEEKLKEMQYLYCLEMTLEIYVTLCKDSEEPNLCLSLDRDVIEFLHRANVHMHLVYSVV